jgi:hypothetical protein
MKQYAGRIALISIYFNTVLEFDVEACFHSFISESESNVMVESDSDGAFFQKQCYRTTSDCDNVYLVP